MRALPKKLLLASGAMALACALAEAVLRSFEPTAVGVSHQPCIYVRDEIDGYAYRPGSEDRMHRLFEMDVRVVINRSGFHDVERPVAATARAFRVAAIGDSFTACLHVPLADGWTQVLERELGRRRGAPGEVRNFGLDGTGTDVQVRILAAQLAGGLRIDTAILAFYENDVDDVAVGRLYREVTDGYVITWQDAAQRTAIVQFLSTHRPAPWVAFAHEHSLLCRGLMRLLGGDELLRSNFVWPGQVGLQIERRRAPGATLQQALRDLAALSQQYGFAVVVAPVPARGDPRGSLSMLHEWAPAAVLQPFAVVDVVPAVERQLAAERLGWPDLFWRHDAHLNAAGNRLYALAVADAMQPK